MTVSQLLVCKRCRAGPNNSFKPTPCRGIGHVLYATLAHVRRPATGRLNSSVSAHREIIVSREDYVAIAVRLFAVYIVFNVVLQIPIVTQALSQEHGAAWAWLHALALLASIAICALLWFFPLTIARKLLPVMKEPRSDQAINASIGLSLGLTLIGVWIFAQGAIDSIYWITLIVRTKQMEQQIDFDWEPDQIASIVTTIFELALAAWLSFGNSGLRRLIYKFRYGE